MNIAVTVAVAVAILFCVARIGMAVVGTILSSIRERRYGRSTEWSAAESGLTGISVAVCGTQSSEAIRQRLTVDYRNCELIVVCDFETAIEIPDIMRRYSMVRMRLFDEERRRCGAIEIYRSRQRRYRRFLLANRSETDIDDCRNCAVAIAAFDRILFLEPDTFLSADALSRFDEAAVDLPKRQIEGFALRPIPNDATEAIDWAVGYTFAAIGADSVERVVLTSRDDAGTKGLRNRRRLRRYTIGTVAQSASSHNRRTLRHGRTTMFVTALWLLLFCITLFERRADETYALLLSAVAVYTAFVASGALALTAAKMISAECCGHEILKTSHRKLFSYPLKHWYRTIIGGKLRSLRKNN